MGGAKTDGLPGVGAERGPGVFFSLHRLLVSNVYQSFETVCITTKIVLGATRASTRDGKQYEGLSQGGRGLNPSNISAKFHSH